jgi:hypothetical protein
MKLTRLALALASGLALLHASAQAEVVSTLDGNLTVIESTAPLGTSLSYLSGGDGLIGIAGSWPVPGTPAGAMNNYDHQWLQFNPAILMFSATPLSQVFAIPGVDHGPSPFENLEFRIFGLDPDVPALEEGHILKIYRDGFDTANTVVGHSDDYTSLWGFQRSYNYFIINAGDRLGLPGGPFSPGEGEIDALAAPAVPEPSTYALLAVGLGALGWQLRRRSAG